MNALVPVAVHADELEIIQRTAKLLAVSGYFDAKGDTPMAVAQVATKILAGRELGFGPFAAVNGIHIIQGKPAVGANLMASAVKGSGRYDYHVRKMSDDEVSIEFFGVRSAGAIRESLGVSSFTLKDATAAGLTSNPTWKKFARNMLFARAMSNGVRWYCPDVFSGNAVYVPEELGASVDGDGNVVDVEPPRRIVDASTGEITRTPTPQPRTAPPVQPQADVDMGMDGGNPFEDAEPPTDEEHSIMANWGTFGDAYEWAIANGCENKFEAKNSMEKIVKAHGGYSKDTRTAIMLAYIRRQREKAAVAEPVAA